MLMNFMIFKKKFHKQLIDDNGYSKRKQKGAIKDIKQDYRNDRRSHHRLP